ncbi:hypothetical protein KR51_00026880 [Rubidibacter lacunae KORDI 51-2]|uniref:Uncharacterized protein n=1 Tax=Rubidibacter lacunae KORDI 51-2 TaxID=582515 RepID=U5DIE0_9CHRO|nr:hypothetical protein [Rubidibacter lacunae]ERN40702.1 hypothetical protein KR51_00026880 [Rubidibacter lacunae KORDI 51-2]
MAELGGRSCYPTPIGLQTLNNPVAAGNAMPTRPVCLGRLAATIPTQRCGWCLRRGARRDRETVQIPTAFIGRFVVKRYHCPTSPVLSKGALGGLPH